MKMSLSNFEIRAYKNKNGFYNFNFRTFFIIESKISFSIGAYLKHFNIVTNIAGSEYKFGFPCTICLSCGPKFDGEFLTAGYHSKIETNYRQLVSQVLKLKIRYLFSFTNHPYEEEEHYSMYGILKVMN